MSYTKLKVYYQGDGDNYGNTTSQLEKKITINLPVQAKKYGDENGYDKISITYSCDHLILKGSNGQTLFDRDVNGEDNNEFITKITRYEWIGDDYVEPKPLNKYSKIKVYHNWEDDGRTLTLPLSKECIEYGDRFGYENIVVSKTGWEFAMVNKEGGIMVYKSFWEADSGVGNIVKIEWLNAEIESDIKKLENRFTKVRVNHGANSKMTVALPKKLTEFGDRFGYDKITFARKGCYFYLYDPDGFILLRKDCWETGLGEIISMEWLNDKSETVPFNPAPSPFEIPVETNAPQPVATPAVEQVPESATVEEPKKETPKPQPAKKVEIKENTVNGKTTYSFNGEDGLSKSKLCLSIIRYYIEQNPDITVSQLREMFNIKNNNMVETIDGALKICDSSGKAGGNYSMKDADQIATKEGKVVVWNYWPERYFNPFMEIVETHVFASSDKKETPKPQPAPAPKQEPKRPTEGDMKVLDKLIESALEDFVVTDEERTVLLNKANEIGLGKDEFKLYLNGKIQERMKDKPEEKVEEKKKGFFARLFGR